MSPKDTNSEKSPPMLEKTDLEPEIASSGRELGRILGVSHAAVQRALRSKRIAPLPDGTFHVPTCRLAWYHNTARRGGRPSKVRNGDGLARAARAGCDRGLEQVEVPASATAAVVETLALADSPVDGPPTFRDAQTAEMILKAGKLHIEVRRLRGKYVESEKAHNALVTFQRVQRDGHLAWPAAVAPAIASELGVTDLALVETVLMKHLRVHLEAMAEVPAPTDLVPTTT